MGTATLLAPEAAVGAAAALLTGGWTLPVAATMSEFAQGALAAGTVLTTSIDTVANHPLATAELAGAAGTGVLVVAGDDRLKDFNCWEKVLHIDEKGFDRPAGFTDEKVDHHRKNGILLYELGTHCKVLQNDKGHVLFKNAYGEHFGFSVSLSVPAGSYESPNAKKDIVILHAIPVSLVGK